MYLQHNHTHKKQKYAVEIKLLFVLCYYAIAGSMIIIAFTYNSIHKRDLIEAMIQYISCESLGTSAECDAEKKAYEPLAGAEIWIITYVLIAAFPAVELVYVVKLEQTKLKLSDCLCVKGKGQPARVNSSSSSSNSQELNEPLMMKPLQTVNGTSLVHV